MTQPSMSLESDGANIELGASLLITTTTTTTTSSSKYNKKWRKSLYIGFLISLKKPTTSTENYEESPPPSPISSVPYTSLPPSPPARTSSAKSSVGIDIPSHTQEGDIAEIVKKKDLKSLLELGGIGIVCDVLHGQSQHSSKVS